MLHTPRHVNKNLVLYSMVQSCVYPGALIITSN